MMQDAEQVYADALVAYRAAKARLRLAKAALQQPRAERIAIAREARMAACEARDDAIVRRIMAGESPAALSAEYQLSVEWVRDIQKTAAEWMTRRQP